MNIQSAHHDDLIDAPDLTVATGSGRATWDERGNSIWEWQTAPGVYSRDISLQQLHSLQAHNLSLQDGAPQRGELSLWSRNDQRRHAQRERPATEVVLPRRGVSANKSSGFEYFLKRLGLPA